MTPNEHDERWDQLALGHVLGGLPDVDASAFRGHLAGCSQCRARVAELRSMASDLAAAEREERATQRLRTQIESRREVPPSQEDDTSERWRRRAVVVGGVVLLLVVALSLWNAHLRSQNSMLRTIAESHARTLTDLGAGTSVPAQTSGDVTGVVGVNGDNVAYSLAGLPELATGERLVVWLEVDGEVVTEDVYLPAHLAREQGRLAASISAPGASRLLVTVEPVTTRFDGSVLPESPGEVIVEAELDGPAEDDGG